MLLPRHFRRPTFRTHSRSNRLNARALRLLPVPASPRYTPHGPTSPSTCPDLAPHGRSTRLSTSLPSLPRASLAVLAFCCLLTLHERSWVRRTGWLVVLDPARRSVDRARLRANSRVGRRWTVALSRHYRHCQESVPPQRTSRLHGPIVLPDRSLQLVRPVLLLFFCSTELTDRSTLADTPSFWFSVSPSALHKGGSGSSPVSTGPSYCQTRRRFTVSAPSSTPLVRSFGLQRPRLDRLTVI